MKTASARQLVLLDATAISEQRGGVGRYVEELAREAVHAGIPLVVVCQPRDEQAFADMNCDVVVAPAAIRSVPFRFFWEQIGLPAVARRVGATVIHSPHYTFPLFIGIRRVVTVHDLTFWSHPDRHSRVKRLFFQTWIRAGAMLGLDVIVPSAATGGELDRVAGPLAGNVTVAYHGVDHEVFRPPTSDERKRFAASVGVTEWVAFLGTIEPRKNVVPLIDGFMTATRNVSSRPSLLLAGAPGWDTGVSAAIERAVSEGFDVRHLGYVPISDLSAFLGGASVVVYPSEGEGFGLPVLEAMSTGAAVVTSRSLSLPEVGGDAVAYSDTTAEAIGAELKNLLGDARRRRELAAAAIARSKQFTWASCLATHRSVWGV